MGWAETQCGNAAVGPSRVQRLVSGVRGVWAGHAWGLLSLGALVALGVGYVGVAAQKPSLGPADWLYGSAQLFWVGGELDSGGAGWQLQVARVLAPLFTLSAIVRSLASAFRQRYDQFLCRFVMRRHIIVCGCGEIGYRVATAAIEAGRGVVVLESSKSANLISDLQRRGVPVIFGNATDSLTLEAAGLRRASHVVAATNSDDANLMLTQAVLDGPSKAAVCVTHVSDLSVWPLACEAYRDSDRVRLVNVHDQAALSMLAALPGVFELPSAGQQRVAIVGTGARIEALAVHLAKRWQIDRTADAGLLEVLIASEDEFCWAEHVARTYPGIDQLLKLESVSLPTSATATARARVLGGCGELQAVLVAIPDASAAASFAIAVAHGHACAGSHSHECYVVALSGTEGALSGASLPNLRFADWGAGFTDTSALLDGSSERMARLAHERYRRVELANAAETGEEPSPTARLTWDELPEYRPRHPQDHDHVLTQNRRQAGSTSRYLESLGCTTTSLLDWDPQPFSFQEEGATPESNEVLRLAIEEHKQWWECMKRLGFAPDPDRVKRKEWRTDYSRRSTPFYVDYWELPERNRRKDQAAIRNIPAKLALIGLRPMRVEAAVAQRAADSEDGSGAA